MKDLGSFFLQYNRKIIYMEYGILIYGIILLFLSIFQRFGIIKKNYFTIIVLVLFGFLLYLLIGIYYLIRLFKNLKLDKRTKTFLLGIFGIILLYNYFLILYDFFYSVIFPLGAFLLFLILILTLSYYNSHK